MVRAVPKASVSCLAKIAVRARRFTGSVTGGTPNAAGDLQVSGFFRGKSGGRGQSLNAYVRHRAADDYSDVALSIVLAKKYRLVA